MLNMNNNANALATACVQARSTAKARLRAGVAGAVMLALAPVTVAHAQQVVTLQSENDSVSISGELLEFDAETYTIKGTLGVITVPRDGVICSGDGCPSLEAEVVSPSLEVVLSSIADETRITGELVTVEPEHYVIRTALGDFRIAIANVECQGQACPAIAAPKPGITMLTADSEYTSMLADLLRSYAEEMGQTIEIDAADPTAQTVQISSGDDQELVATINLEVRNPADAVQEFSSGAANLLVFDQQRVAGLFANYDGPRGVVQNPLAFDGQVIVGHGDNPVRDLSGSEIDEIWNGEITSWRPLGGGDFPITLHMVEDGSNLIGWLTGLRASSTRGVVTHSSEEDVIAAVNADRNALGIVHWASAKDAHAKMMDMRRSCGLSSKPSEFGLRTLHYPFAHPINTYGHQTGMQDFTRAFLDWTQTAAAADSVSQRGYLGAQPQRIRLEDMGDAVIHTAAVEQDFDGVEFASMMRELQSADRLSTTFRFISGSTVLDDASIANAKNLAQRLRGTEFADQELLLVGFADSTGPAVNNSALSVRRATAVREVLDAELDEATRAKIDLVEMGYGEQMPVDCNTTETGRENNRRVEVWLRLKS